MKHSSGISGISLVWAKSRSGGCSNCVSLPIIKVYGNPFDIYTDAEVVALSGYCASRMKEARDI
jgi:hypothetical protein